jgi:MFS family permease
MGLGSFMTPVVQTEWQLSQVQASTLASIFYIGVFLGSIISGELSDIYGRRPIIISGSVFQLLAGGSFLFVNSYPFMVLARTLYGFAYGYTIAITTTVLAEITPNKFRGKGILLLNFCISVGKLYGLFLAYLTLESFTSGNWRLMMVCSCLPNIIILVSSIRALRESPRYLVAHNRIPEACSIFNEMIAENHPSSREAITHGEMEQVNHYYDETFRGK